MSHKMQIKKLCKLNNKKKEFLLQEFQALVQVEHTQDLLAQQSYSQTVPFLEQKLIQHCQLN